MYSGRVSPLLYGVKVVNLVDKLIKSVIAKSPEAIQVIDVAALNTEQEAFARAASWANKLQTKANYRAALATLIAARQLYAVVYTELQQLLEKEGADQPEWARPHPLTEDLFIQAAMHKASQPFSEHDLFQGMASVVMPYLAEVIDRHTEEDEKTAKLQQEEMEKERRARGIPIGFLVDVTDEQAVIDRQRPLTLVGWSSAVYWVLHEITRTVCQHDDQFVYQVIHFVDGQIRPGDSHARLLRVGRSLWEGCADNRNRMPTVMAVLLDKLTTPPDLIVCDNLAAAYTRGFLGRPHSANAGDGNKGISRWCKEAGCALLGGVPLDEEANPDVSHPCYEQLRTFTKLRPVLTENLADGKIRIRVGRSTHYWDVDRSELDAVAPRNIQTVGVIR